MSNVNDDTLTSGTHILSFASKLTDGKRAITHGYRAIIPLISMSECVKKCKELVNAPTRTKIVLNGPSYTYAIVSSPRSNVINIMSRSMITIKAALHSQFGLEAYEL